MAASSLLGKEWETKLYLATDPVEIQKNFMGSIADYIEEYVIVKGIFSGNSESGDSLDNYEVELRIDPGELKEKPVSFADPAGGDGASEWMDWVKGVYKEISDNCGLEQKEVPEEPDVEKEEEKEYEWVNYTGTLEITEIIVPLTESDIPERTSGNSESGEGEDEPVILYAVFQADDPKCWDMEEPSWGRGELLTTFQENLDDPQGPCMDKIAECLNKDMKDNYVIEFSGTLVAYQEKKEEPLDPMDDPDKERLDEYLELCLIDIIEGSGLQIPEEGPTREYLMDLTNEAYSQFYEDTSLNEIPSLVKAENFPCVYNYFGGKEDTGRAFRTLMGWLIAEQLSELCPLSRNNLYKVGYELGGYTREQSLYGYDFKSDPNVARLVASVIYSTMRTLKKPDINAMREELGGTTYNMTLEEILDHYARVEVGDNDFYIDFRKFMNSAPGPYAPGYKDRSRNNPTFPDQKASNGCLQMDMDIYNYVVDNNNIPEQTAVQATADKESEKHHMFGTDKRNVKGYDFNAVFGQSTIGFVINPDYGDNQDLMELVNLVLSLCSSSRGILQHSNSSVGPVEYGRLRPGCSESSEGVRKSYSNNKLNILVDFDIEDNDGCKETYWDGSRDVYYYDENGNWTNVNVQSKEDYANLMMDNLYANSYPSGHSACIWGTAMVLMEIYPNKADLIMRAANNYAINRTVSRFHWTSDTIAGRVIGSATNPVCHATEDYETLISYYLPKEHELIDNPGGGGGNHQIADPEH